MAPSLSTASIRSSRRDPCPVCGRSKDGDCEIRSDGGVFCHRGSSHYPPDWAIRPGSYGIGADGQAWAFLGDSDLGHAMFRPHQPQSGKGTRPRLRSVDGGKADRAPQPAPINGPIRLARLPEGVELPDLGREKAAYDYSAGQRTIRDTTRDGGKVLPFHRVGERAKAGAGPDPWPLYQQGLALAADGWLLELEGERCVGLAMAAGVVAITQPGHDHTSPSITRRYRTLAEARLPGVVYVSDHDAEGQRKATVCAEAAAAAGLPFLHLPASKVWPGIAEKGSIDDAPGTAAEQIAAIEAAISTALQEQPPAEEPLREEKGEKVRRHRLAPDEVLAQLPQRIGNPRLNNRSRDIHVGGEGRILSRDAASRLYIHLGDTAHQWPKEATYDAVLHLAEQNQFDPVADYLGGLSPEEGERTEPLPMDQWERLDHHLLGIEDPIAAFFLPQFLISAVARTFDPGCYVRRWPVLVGGQEKGKSQLGRILFGDAHWVEGLKGRNEADIATRCHTAWGVELAELNGITRRADQEWFKAFLTEQTDTVRRAWGRGEERMPRRFVFWGTSNAPPLRDATGETRYVSIPIEDRDLPLDWAKANRDAIWARALQQYRSGVSWHALTPEQKQQIAERNQDHKELDPWAEKVAAFLARRTESNDLPVKLHEILEALEVPTERQHGHTGARARAIAESLGWTHQQRWISRKEGIKKAGLWPPVAHNGPQLAHRVVGHPEASQEEGSQLLAHMAHNLCELREGKEEEAEQRGGVQEKNPEVDPKVVGHFPPTENPCAGTGFGGGSAKRVVGQSCGPSLSPPGSVSPRTVAARPPDQVIERLRALRQADPDALPAQLANRLAQHGIEATGRQVKGWLPWLESGP